MAKRVLSRRELLERWRDIEEQEELEADDTFNNADSSPSLSLHRLQQQKEEWFSAAYNFLISLPQEHHIWCEFWDIMGPLLETFFNYFKVKGHDSALKILWERISREMRRCTECVSRHHQAQEMYKAEYESSFISPLLDILQFLDEERVSEHLKEVNARHGGFDPPQNNAEIVSLMFEVLTFPMLLEDESIVNEFQTFIEAVDDAHELTLAKQQNFPGVYALLFFKSRKSRSIGHRLAGNMKKLRCAADLEPLQPLLKRCIGFLAAEVLQSSSEISRPRLQMERTTVWLGLKALLAFLEPPALEEGILEPYPVFLNFILDHISDDSPEFSHAVNCMRLLFEILGCKLWLRTSLPPSVMRDSLLSQCFHTRNEKTHKEIFDLFHPLLQSLEALHDGEFEKQRRHLLYFLLHQVTRSSNFSMLMRKKACQIAFLIIHRGYRMNPPSPPVECAHMWGPSLVSSLKDLSLHTSLRQPAIDLIQTIIVSDATALLSSLFHCQAPTINSGHSVELAEENDDSSSCYIIASGKDVCHWSEFITQGNIVSQEYSEWMCAPMLWLDVLADIEPSILPLSASKAVLWALSRFSMVEPENSSELSLPVRTWLSSSVSEVTAYFGWKFPTGSDDGGNGKTSKNSVRVSTLCIPLIRTFRRLAAHFIVQMEQGELRMKWTWESQMGETLVLLLSDPNDNVRQVGRRILEHVSNSRGLTSGLQFLCHSESSLATLFSGLKHGLKLVQLDSVLVSFQSLHHFFFVLYKIFKEGFSPTNHLLGTASEEGSLKFATQGGFLRQPTLDSLNLNKVEVLPKVEKTLWENFNAELAAVAWPTVKKCLHKGKAFIDYRISQLTGERPLYVSEIAYYRFVRFYACANKETSLSGMIRTQSIGGDCYSRLRLLFMKISSAVPVMTCVRLLEILPIIFAKVCPLPDGVSGNSSNKLQTLSNFSWLNDLIDWGKSSLEAVIRYWKQSVTSLLVLLKSSCNEKSIAIVTCIEKMISSEAIQMDSLAEQASRLSISLSTKDSSVDKSNLKSNYFTDGLVTGIRRSPLNAESSDFNDSDVQILDSLPVANEKHDNSPILLSDEEGETSTCCTHVTQDDRGPAKVNVSARTTDKTVSEHEIRRKASVSGTLKILPAASEKIITPKPAALTSMSNRLGIAKHALASVSLPKVNDRVDVEKEMNSNSVPKEQSSSISKATGRSSVAEPVKNKHSMNASKQNASESTAAILKELVQDGEDPLELALKSAGRNHSSLRKQGLSLPKRQVIQLAAPVDSRSAYLRKLEATARRFKPPKLDDWFRPILEMDYFASVGLTSPHEEENKTPCDLKKVPVSFESPQQYVNIFRPLVLEEFKAQLNSSFQELSSLEEMLCGSISVVSVERVDDFHLVRCVHDERDFAESSSCMENDLVLLTKQPLKDSPHNVHIVGKVERREKDNKRRQNMLLIRFYLQSGYSRINRARKLLLERSKWFLSRVMSITPQLREFQALSSIEVIPALPVVLEPSNHFRASKERRKADLGKLPRPLRQVFESTFNESQIQAISAVIQTPDSADDFTLSLVQGPPGTGKTRTIVALISALLAVSSRSSAMEKQSSVSTKVSSNPFTNFKARISESAAIARAWQDAALARQLNNDSEKDKKVPKASSRKRVLVCAQSNAAVDELVSRLAGEGIYGFDGIMYKPYLVRVGNSKTVHPNSLPFFIDTLVEHRLAEEKMTGGNGKNELSEESSTTLRESLEQIVDRIKFYESKRADLKDGGSDKNVASENEPAEGDCSKRLSNAGLDSRLRSLYQQKREIYTRLATIQAREKKINEDTKALRNKLRRSILREAEIVVTTLSGCGGDLYAACFESSSNGKGANMCEQNLFDAVVIDEAAQALEPATLIPLQLLKSSGTKCIMVGDPKQLPATVLSNVASRYLYECSMFERIQRAGHPVIMLTEQYRMHPEISRFPSLHFYDGKLLNGVQLSSKTAPFHKTKALGPYVFYDITDGQELFGKSSGSSSLYNEGEADAAVEIVRFLQKRYPSEFAGGRIGVITPYKAQLSLLRSRFSRALGSSVSSEIEFNTVDGFQGREVDILILSTVRSSDTSPASRMNSSGIGFVADVRRMNVALTRARLSLWVMGSAKTLQRNSDWGALIQDAKKRNLVISVKRPYKSVFELISSQSSIPENSGTYLEETCEKTKRRQHVVRNESNCEENSKRKGNFVSNERPSRETREQHPRTTTDYLPSAKKKVDIADADKQSLEKQKALEDACRSGKKFKKTRGDQSEFEKDIINEMSNERGSGGLKNPVHHPKSMEIRSASASDVNHKSKGTGTDEAGQSSSGIEKPKDAISKRKQQREAVDALLSSALIPSKKSESLSKVVPQKRPRAAPANGGDCLRQVKQHKDRFKS